MGWNCLVYSVFVLQNYVCVSVEGQDRKSKSACKKQKKRKRGI